MSRSGKGIRADADDVVPERRARRFSAAAVAGGLLVSGIVPELEVDFLDVIAGGETDRGNRRSINEDMFLIRSDLGLYVVADGAGGHSAGNVASAIAGSTVSKFFDSSEADYRDRAEVDAFGLWWGARRLSQAVQEANRAVIEIARSSNKYRGMGTTVTCVLLSAATGRIHVAHVGDSRCYRLRHGNLERLTRDHSILNDVLELHPGLDDVALARLPSKAITRALGMDAQVRVSVHSGQALPGDRYLLCSDGVTNELGDGVIEELLATAGSPADVVRDLVRTAKDVGGRDNITAVVIDCKPNSSGARRPPLGGNGTAFEAPNGVEIRDGAGGEQPEIVLLDSQHTEEGSDPRISIVPVHSADANMIRAIDYVAAAIGPSTEDCPACGETLDHAAIVCSKCGHSQAEPLSVR